MQSVSVTTSDTYHHKERHTVHTAAAAVVTESGRKAAMCLSHHQRQYSLLHQPVTIVNVKVVGGV